MSDNASVPADRVGSVDAYRGFVMFLMMAEVLRISRVAQAFPDNAFWQALSFHTSHVAWTGCSLHDLIQPSFSFLVGVAVPYSIASRVARGQTFGWMLAHAAWRALLLVALGIFLRSVGRPMTNFTFVDTLTQIGLGYVFLFLLGFGSQLVQWLALAAVLGGYWLAFIGYPLPGPDFDHATVGVAHDWAYHFTGLEAHFNKNTNLAWAFDTWFLNLFPQESEFRFNSGGYATLSFIPTLGTMIMGLIAGGWLKSAGSGGGKVVKLAAAGLAFLAAATLLDVLDVCPIVKRIWTPAWALYSGGWCFLLLAALYLVIDVAGWKAWAFPLVVIGMNSIAIYCIVHLMGGFIVSTLHTHLGQNFFKPSGTWFGVSAARFEPLLLGSAVLLIYWLILFWMYRRRIFLRI